MKSDERPCEDSTDDNVAIGCLHGMVQIRGEPLAWEPQPCQRPECVRECEEEYKDMQKMEEEEATQQDPKFTETC